MEFEKVKELIKIIDNSNITLFEFQNSEGNIIKMDKLSTRFVDQESILKTSDVLIENKQSKKSLFVNEESAVTIEKDIDRDNENIELIKSPMVGTFYSKPSPDAEAFIKEGDIISKGKVVCIIEAMKLMNEIESEISGEVEKCLLKDGDMVEYGQPLYRIKK